MEQSFLRRSAAVYPSLSGLRATIWQRQNAGRHTCSPAGKRELRAKNATAGGLYAAD
jgi:hypothetical protein